MRRAGGRFPFRERVEGRREVRKTLTSSGVLMPVGVMQFMMASVMCAQRGRGGGGVGSR